MILKDFLPTPAVREFVYCYRIVHFEFDKVIEAVVKVYPPKPEACLLFYLREREQIQLSGSEKKDYQLPAVLIGQQTSMMKRFTGKNFLNFQIVFQPTALFRLTGIPAYELSNKYFDAENIFSENIRFVFEELQHAPGYNEMILIADSFVKRIISKKRKDNHLLDAISNLMIQHDGNISVDWMAKESCLCIKQFKRKFNERAGVNPKTYGRIIRLNKAFNIKNAHPDWDWLKIAIECDYFDYQHLVKDYHTFTGLHPKELHLLEHDSPENRLGLTSELYQNRIRLNSLLF